MRKYWTFFTGPATDATPTTVAEAPAATPSPTDTPPANEIATPTLNSPSAGEVLTAGEIALNGTGEPGSKVEIVVNGQVVGTATVGSDGQWSFTTTIDEPGEYEISLNGLDAEGQVTASSEPVVVTIETPPVEVATPALDSPSAGEVLTAGEIALNGTGESGTEVEIVVNGQVIGTATVGSDGQWSFTTTIDEPGEYEISLNGLDAEGQVTASSEPVAVTIEAAGPTCREEYVVVVDDWLSRLSDKYWADMFLYPDIVTATNQKHEVDETFATIADPDLIEPGWKLCIVDADTAAELAE